MAATARLVVMLEPDDKRKLEADANDAKVSVAELVRRRVRGTSAGDEQAFMEALVDLGTRVDELTHRMGMREKRDASLDSEQAEQLKKVRALTTKALRSGRFATLGDVASALEAEFASINSREVRA